MSGWFGVDWDGTLFTYDRWRGASHLGEPIMPSIRRVRHWLNQGKEVRIVTARVHPKHSEDEIVESTKLINDACYKHFGKILPITCSKDKSMILLLDDRALQVFPNTGETLESRIHKLEGIIVELLRGNMAAAVKSLADIGWPDYLKES